ncbi:MAG TPA: FAD-binding oxidoreductase [Candidatus Lokiarchaeia archaeon]|nr:FAD-binding oxidoreductase [Candidatus Lokiarchaeia archaeon]
MDWSDEERSEIKQLLVDIVGERWVSNDVETLSNYGRDMTENEPHRPDFVVLPDNVEQVQKIVLLANERKIPLIPYVAGANVGGLTIPTDLGGITVDLKRMNRVIELNKQDKYIVIEPGFTFGHLRRLFDTEIPEFRYSFPFAPPFTSVMTNALLHGLGSLSVLYGSADQFINGMEVVLPTGEIVNVGTQAVNKQAVWYGRAPLPDAAGLFIGWQGTTGIVTKMSIQLIDRPRILEHFAIIPEDPYDFLEHFVHDLVKLGVCDEIGIGYFPAKVGKGMIPDYMLDLMARMMHYLRFQKKTTMVKRIWPLVRALSFGNPFNLVKKLAPLLRMGKSDDDQAWLIAGITIGAHNEHIFKAKYKAMERLCKKAKPPVLLLPTGDFGDLKKVFMSILDLPTQLPALYDLKAGGGLTWVGSYVPASRVHIGMKKGEEIHKKNHFFPVIVMRPHKQDHYFVLRFILAFDRKSSEETARARQTLQELAAVILDDCKGVPYKPAGWAVKMIQDRADPASIELLKRVKQFMDPNHVMNPGRLEFE